MQFLVDYSPHTDVLVLLLKHHHTICGREIYIHTGRKGKYAGLSQFIPVHTLWEQLTRSTDYWADIVHVSHTHYDSIRSFCWHGKKVPKTRKYMQLSTLGHRQDITASQVEVATQFVGELNGSATCQSINKLKCERVQKNTTSTCKLSPTDDHFMQHLHAKFQLLNCKKQVQTCRYYLTKT